MIIYTSDINFSDFAHKRIISLVPSITETLFYLGLKNNVVGVTDWCKYPEKEIAEITKVGGVKTFNKDLIYNLKPDLIIAVKEENNKEEIEAIAQDFNVFVATVESFDDSLKLINDIGLLTKTSLKANELSKQIESDFNNIYNFNGRTCAYFVWNKPKMLVGGNTFINSFLHKCNLDNVFKNINSYPIVDDEEIKECKPEIIFLCSEPFEFKDKHRLEYQMLFPESKVVLIDAEIFTWYGSRLLKARSYMNKISQTLLKF